MYVPDAFPNNCSAVDLFAYVPDAFPKNCSAVDLFASQSGVRSFVRSGDTLK